MKYIVIALLLLPFVTDHAFARPPSGSIARMTDVCGPCASGYGCCAERASMADCISCGLCFHGVEKRNIVLKFCHTYQRFHKNPCLGNPAPRWCSLPPI